MNRAASEPDAHDSRSLHERIAADLRDDIMSGELTPGGALPSTVRLKERFGASSATVQKALQLLKSEGLVIGRAGAAVTVREHRQRTIRPAPSLIPARSGGAYPWLTEIAQHGTQAASRLLEVAEVVPPPDVRAALGLPADGTAILRRQLLTVDDEPAELVSSYYPLEIAAGTPLAERRRIKGGSPTLLIELGHPARLSVDRVSARMPTQQQCRTLRLPGNLPVLRTLRIVYGDNERAVEVGVLVKAGHLYEVQYEYAPEPNG
ncbi:GntR family transcriptional regulator [Streptomyces sp. NPDC006691]|uniref:GntR family transcriptional regulator n=1 Tax=Streptomyces sp. NPDC006691 TaxID=3364757 RepID=UPI00369DB1E0